MTAPDSEEVPFSGDTLLTKVKELIREGNIRRVVIKNEEGRVLVDIPLTVGVVGTLLAPQLAAIGAIAALVLRGSILIEKENPAGDSAPTSPESPEPRGDA
jgi:CBS domain-containing protein